MISPTGLSHVGIAVPDLEAAAAHWGKCFDAQVSAPKDVPEQGLRMVYVRLGSATIELMSPTRPDSPIAKFLERNPAGGIHHLSLSVPDAEQAAEGAGDAGLRIVGPGEPRSAHHGRPIFFLHPKDLTGTLVEIEEQERA
jgi:methylmalonyl-CoA/ethylmalonyl-CoA epimerase